MTRGKEAIQAAARREQAARQLLRDLSDELAELKADLREANRTNALMRARTAELDDLRAKLDADELYADAIEACNKWRDQAAANRARQKAACLEFKTKLGPDLSRRFGNFGGDADYAEHVFRRYPAIIGYLLGRDIGDNVAAVYTTKRDRHARNYLSDDRLRRFQRIIGTRSTLQWAEDKDAADVYNDLLDAKNVGFTPDEILEYLGADPT